MKVSRDVGPGSPAFVERRPFEGDMSGLFVRRHSDRGDEIGKSSAEAYGMTRRRAGRRWGVGEPRTRSLQLPQMRCRRDTDGLDRRPAGRSSAW